MAEQMTMPPVYGEATRLQPWSAVRERLVAAKQYWVATFRAAGSPHLTPVDGLWVDDVLYYGGSPETLHVRTAKANPHVTIHLPDPWNVVVVEGVVEVTRPSEQLRSELADLANVKYAAYGIQFDVNSYSEPFVLHPQRVIAWSSFPTDATRFVF